MVRRLIPLSAMVLLGVACGSSHSPHRDAAPARDAGTDAGTDAAPPADSGSGTRCTHPTDCRLMPRSCCGNCGAHMRDDIISVHVDDVEAARTMACAGGSVCPGCFLEADSALIADCSPEGQCTYVDLYDPENDHRSVYTACERDEDCVLRTTDCCECGATVDHLVAVHVDQRAALEALVCAPGMGCDDCSPNYEPAFAWCSGDTGDMPKHCRVDFDHP